MLEFYSDQEMYTFDDVCLAPQYSKIVSRKDVDLTSGKLRLRSPIISANMDSITGYGMLKAMMSCGGLGILHRFMTLTELESIVDKFYNEVDHAYEHLALSVGVKQSKEYIEYCTHSAKIICVDIAHGHSEHTINTIRKIKSFSPKSIIIAGNVATSEAVEDLANAGASILKIGIGPGSFCSTRVVTGHGIPQLSAIAACAEKAKKLGVEIIADGGIRSAGDAAKAIGAGADYIMVGSLLSATDETPGAVEVIDGKKYKKYRGSASFEIQAENGLNQSEIVPEGVSQWKLCKGPVKDIIYQLCGGLKSALSYSGAQNIQEFKQKAKFVRVTSNSYIEGTPHGLKQ